MRSKTVVATFGVVGVFMLGDAIISMIVPTDKRPWLQAGRIVRECVGLGLIAAALRNLK